MPIQKLRQYLDQNNVRYVVISHSKAYTAQGVAESAHLSGKELAKSVMLNKDGSLCMAVLPASRKVNLAAFAKLAGARDVSLASEAEFRDRFPDCEVGAMPPFGNLYGVPVYADASLGRNSEIAFNAGSHLELIRMTYDDFNRLVQPTVLDYAAGPISHAA